MFVQEGAGRGGASPREKGKQQEVESLGQDLKTLRLRVSLLQTSCLLAREGQSRVTSSEVLFRARREFGVDVPPSTVGQTMGGLGIPSSITKGKTRFLIDARYMESLIPDLETEILAVESRLEAAIRSFGDVAARLEPLEERYQRAYRLVQREQELKQFLQQHPGPSLQSTMLENQAEQVRARLARRQQLEIEVQSMKQQLAQRPEGLQQRRNALDEQVREVESQEVALAEEEQGLETRLTQLQTRGRHVTLAQLDLEISQRRRTLKSMDREIEQQRSLLDKLLHRNQSKRK